MTDSSKPADIQKLGKYIIESELGQGAMGVVYKGFDPMIERNVALKTIRKDLLSHADIEIFLTRFKREAQAAGRLNHPNVVSVYEYGEDGNTAFIAMEFVRGRELKHFFEQNERFDISDIFRIMSQILGALAYSHQHGVVHRDIKPANIIVMDNGQIKITDFGIAHFESSDLTQTGMVIGTPNYMSPEQFTGNRVDGRSDLFCAGVILYQLITGENPFHGQTMATIMHKVLNVEPINPSELNLHISSALNNVIRKSIAKRPEDRFQTAEDFFQAIDRAVSSDADRSSRNKSQVASNDPEATVIINGSSRQPDVKPDTPTPGTRKRRKKLSLVWLIIVVGILTAVGLSFWTNGEKTAQVQDYGYINLFTKPWTTVYFNGKSYGNTPIARLKVPAGSVELRFVNDNQNIDVTEVIHVKPDAVIRKRFEWK